MLVLHASWLPYPDGPSALDRLRVWAESTDLPREPPAPGHARIRAHPFAIPADQLAAALAGAGRTRPGSTLVPDTADLLLPTRAKVPVPSPLLGVADATERAARPGRWRVPVLDLGGDDALALLRPRVAAPTDAETVGTDADAGTETDADTGPQVVVGDDVRVWQSLAAFALDLAGRGRVLPTVLEAARGLGLALWRPLVTGDDAQWLRALAVAVPHLAPASLASACDVLADAAVRAALAAAGASGPATSGPATTSRPAVSTRQPTRQPTPQATQQPGRRRPSTWRTALLGPSRTFPASPAQLAALRRDLEAWQADAVSTRSLRAVFRLVEPPEPIDDDAGVIESQVPDMSAAPDVPDAPTPEAGWRLDFALQPADEPSLVVDAAQVWRSRRPKALAGYPGRPQEALLGELGRAVRLYPAIEAALHTARPAHLDLSTAEAHAFLTDAAPVLLGAGFGVVVPGWWSRPAARLGARLHASTPPQPGAAAREGAIGKEGIADFRWDLAIGDDTLSEAEIEHLVSAQQPLVKIRGQWMQIDPDRLRRARTFLARRAAPGRLSLIEVLRTAAGADDGPEGLPVVGVHADGWLGDLLSGAADRHLAPVAAPEGFTGTLRPYQERGLAWLAFHEAVGTGVILADDMGLGKTVQLLALMRGDASSDASSDPDARLGAPTLLVCPTSVVGNWQREAARFTPGVRVHVHHGSERPRGAAFTDAVAASDLVVTTYALLVRDADALREVTWRRVVLDEAQAIKNAATKAAVAARSIPAPHRIAVTGTPVENRLADLWSIMEFANPGLLGTPKEFKDDVATPVERYGDEEAAGRLRALTQPFVLRRVKTDTSIIADLPAKLEMEVVCSLTREQAGLYSSVVTDMLERLEDPAIDPMQRRGLVLATMTRLKQVCNHPAQFLGDGSRLAGRSGKLERCEEILEEVLAAGEKALIFTQFAEFGHMLKSHLAARTGREVVYLHGGLSRTERDAMVARFQGDGGPPLFVLSLKAGGTGLTLTAANHVVHVDRWWNPAVEDQATDRAFRIGQTKQVQVRKFVCAGTLEEKIAAMIADKRGLAASVVGTGEAWLTELSTAALRELFTLEPGAVAA